MALPVENTLGELRARVQKRLGMASQGAAAGINAGVIDDFIQDAQEEIWVRLDMRRSLCVWEFTVGQDQTSVDYPLSASAIKGAGDCNPEELKELRVNVYTDFWVLLQEGINEVHDTLVDTKTYPRRFDRFDQLEIWPKPDVAYTLRAEGYPTMARFTQDGDRASVPDDLVFRLALAMAKAHYRHPDAKNAEMRFERLLAGYRTKGRGDERHIPPNKTGGMGSNASPWPRPILDT